MIYPPGAIRAPGGRHELSTAVKITWEIIMDRFVWTHPTTETPAPHAPVAPAQPGAWAPADPAAYPVAYPPVAPVYVPVTTTTRGRTPHGLHAIMTVCTLGAWVPVWIMHAVFNHCTITRTTTRQQVR